MDEQVPDGIDGRDAEKLLKVDLVARLLGRLGDIQKELLAAEKVGRLLPLGYKLVPLLFTFREMCVMGMKPAVPLGICLHEMALQGWPTLIEGTPEFPWAELWSEEEDERA